MTAGDRSGRVGVIGLGAMGRGVASRLTACGFEVVGFDVDDACNRRAAAGGAVIAAGLADVARDAARIVCLVDTGAAVLDVAAAVAPRMGPGDTFICMSTIDLEVIEAAAGIIEGTGAAYLDAPVSGGGAAAEAGSLVSIVGGPDTAAESCRPVIEALSSRWYHVGGVGKGFAAKMVNNLMFHTLSVSVIEAMVLATRAGLDPERTLDLLGTATGDSAALRMRAPRFLARDFEGVPLSVAFRELMMETGLATRHGVPIPLGRMAEEVHRMGIARGLGDQDGAALVQLYEDWAGMRVTAREAGT